MTNEQVDLLNYFINSIHQARFALKIDRTTKGQRQGHAEALHLMASCMAGKSFPDNDEQKKVFMIKCGFYG